MLTLLPLLWVFKYKFNIDGYLMKFKARLYIYSDLQTTKQDIYVATLATYIFQVLIAISAAFNLKASQFNAINAFINNDLNKEIYY
jgi:hypothetical protein